MIKNIQITKLFGLYDYNIDFECQEDGCVTVLTGPNGYGKTTILKIIDDVYNQRFLEFYTLPFETICLEFASNDAGSSSSILIEKESSTATTDNDDIAEEVCNVKFCYMRNGKEIETFDLPKAFVDNLIKNTKLFYRSRGLEMYETDEEFLRSPRTTNDIQLQRKGRSLRMFLQEETSLFVPAQRIYSNTRVPNGKRTEMTNILESLKEEYNRQINQYAAVSQQVDSTFVTRLMENKDNPELTEGSYKEQVEKIKYLAKQYGEVGLSPSVNIPEEFPDKFQNTISQHLKDSLEKMAVLEPFWKKLSTFLSCIRRKGLADKEIYAHPQKGLYCILNKKIEIPLYSLSSGERNLIVLYYRLIFGKNNNSLILIDEPENSMHPAWLNTMMDDMLEMARTLKIQVIVATHSPSFISNHWNHTIDLYGISRK